MAGKKRRRDPPPSHSQLPNGASDTLTTASTGITDASVLPATSPQDGLGFLLGQEELLNFQATTWERCPRVYRGKKSTSRSDYFRDLCDLAAFQHHVEEVETPLLFGVDLNATRYVDGIKETANGQVADAESIRELWQEGCTLQVVQPQRWEPRLMALVAALERQLGCLVGVNAYLTPPGTQGLAPHHDAVELFVCQTAGSKSWRLYNPVNNHALPAMPSGDLDPLDLGEPIAEITLQVGDVLYLPKGTVHQAVASPVVEDVPKSDRIKDHSGGKARKASRKHTAALAATHDTGSEEAPPHSAHLTISTYNRWSYADLLATLLRVAEAGSAEREASLPLRLRRGLPFDFLASHGLQASLARTKKGATNGATSLAAGLRKLASDIEQRPDLLDAAADDMAQGFLRLRAPPFGSPTSAPDKGKAPSRTSHVFAAAPGCFRLIACSEEEMIEAGGNEDDIDSSGGFVRLVSCLHNTAQNHMMAPSQGTQGDASDDESGAHCSGDELKANGPCDNNKHKGGCCGAGNDHKVGGHSAAADILSDDQNSEGGEASDDESDVDELVLPAAHAAAAAALLSAPSSAPLPVKSVPLPTLEDRLTLAHALWDIGAITVARQ